MSQSVRPEPGRPGRFGRRRESRLAGAHAAGPPSRAAAAGRSRQDGSSAGSMASLVAKSCRHRSGSDVATTTRWPSSQLPAHLSQEITSRAGFRRGLLGFRRVELQDIARCQPCPEFGGIQIEPGGFNQGEQRRWRPRFVARQARLVPVRHLLRQRLETGRGPRIEDHPPLRHVVGQRAEFVVEQGQRVQSLDLRPVLAGGHLAGGTQFEQVDLAQAPLAQRIVGPDRGHPVPVELDPGQMAAAAGTGRSRWRATPPPPARRHARRARSRCW